MARCAALMLPHPDNVKIVAPDIHTDSYELVGLEARLYIRNFSTLYEAQNCWGVINSAPDGLAYTVRVNGKLFVVGIASGLESEKDRRVVSLRWGDYDDDDDLDLAMTPQMIVFDIDELKEDVYLTSSLIASHGQKPTEVASDNIAAMSFSAAMGNKTTLVKEDRVIAGLAQAVGGTWDIENSAMTYVCVRAWLACNKEHVLEEFGENLGRELSKLRAHVKGMEGRISKVIENDISLVWQWVKKSGFIPGENLDKRSVTSMASALLDIKTGIKVSTTLTTSKINELDLVIDMSRLGVTVDQGMTSDLLYKQREVDMSAPLFQDDFDESMIPVFDKITNALK